MRSGAWRGGLQTAIRKRIVEIRRVRYHARRDQTLLGMSATKGCGLRSGFCSRFVYCKSRNLLGKHAWQCALFCYASCLSCERDRELQTQPLGVQHQIVLPAVVHVVVEIVTQIALARRIGSRDAPL